MPSRPDAASPVRDRIRAEIRRQRAARPTEQQLADDRLRDARVLALVSELLGDQGSDAIVALSLIHI